MKQILSSLVFLALLPSTAVAQINSYSSLGAESSVVESSGDRDTISGGATRDANLFHSFQEFNVGAGRGELKIWYPRTAVRGCFLSIGHLKFSFF